jgi:hypothetical protein
VRREIRLLLRAYRLLRISRPADPRDCAKFDRVMMAIERYLGMRK